MYRLKCFIRRLEIELTKQNKPPPPKKRKKQKEGNDKEQNSGTRYKHIIKQSQNLFFEEIIKGGKGRRQNKQY